MAARAAYDERFVHFIVLFNVDQDYFECHEVMEELWLEEGRNMLCQGLLQAAVGLHHWRNDNYSGARKLFDQALNKLIQYPGVMMGLDLNQLRSDIERSVEPLRRWVDVNATELAEPAQLMPPVFRSFEVVVVDDHLRQLAKALADIPLEVRLHGEEHDA